MSDSQNSKKSLVNFKCPCIREGEITHYCSDLYKKGCSAKPITEFAFYCKSCSLRKKDAVLLPDDFKLDKADECFYLRSRNEKYESLKNKRVMANTRAEILGLSTQVDRFFDCLIQEMDSDMECIRQQFRADLEPIKLKELYKSEEREIYDPCVDLTQEGTGFMRMNYNCLSLVLSFLGFRDRHHMSGMNWKLRKIFFDSDFHNLDIYIQCFIDRVYNSAEGCLSLSPPDPFHDKLFLLMGTFANKISRKFGSLITNERATTRVTCTYVTEEEINSGRLHQTPHETEERKLTDFNGKFPLVALPDPLLQAWMVDQVIFAVENNRYIGVPSNELIIRKKTNYRILNGNHRQLFCDAVDFPLDLSKLTFIKNSFFIKALFEGKLSVHIKENYSKGLVEAFRDELYRKIDEDLGIGPHLNFNLFCTKSHSNATISIASTYGHLLYFMEYFPEGKKILSAIQSGREALEQIALHPHFYSESVKIFMKNRRQSLSFSK